MNKYYTITLSAGTTSPGPYTIHLNQSGGTIPLLYPELTLAQNIDRDVLLAGITIQTPDVPTSVIIVNEYCNTIKTLIPPTTTTYKDFCLKIINIENITRFLHFIPNGLVGGYPSWKDDATPPTPITVTYDNIHSQWIVNNYNPGSGIIISNSPSTANPPNSWRPSGVGVSVNYNEGSCVTEKRSSFPVSVNQPTCGKDGSITFNVYSYIDNPPYSYSIDNGVTYSSSPMFTELVSGLYTLSVLDSLGESFSKSVTLEKPIPSTTYIMSLNTNRTTPVNNNVSLVNSYETTVTITPPLPDGTTVTFDLIHTNSFYSSPTSGTSILTTGTVLTKNTTKIEIDSTITGNTKSVNQAAGCQNEFVYQLDTNDVWDSLTITNSDNIVINTTSRVDKTITGKCVVGYSNDTYSISNPIISGCDCCSIIIN
jgi:hypothetical protein